MSERTTEQPAQFSAHRIRWVAISLAVVFLGVAIPVAVLLRQSETGLDFAVSDQVAIGLLGLLLALGALMLLRPRVRADDDGVSVRNIFFSRRFSWGEILSVSFPDGAMFARLELAEDEYYAVLAVQAVDRRHAVEAVRTLRRFHRAAVRRARGQQEAADSNENAPGAETPAEGEG